MSYAISSLRIDKTLLDGGELTRTFHRNILNAGTLDASDNLVDTDISAEPAEVQLICNAAWTTTVKDALKAYLLTQNIES